MLYSLLLDCCSSSASERLDNQSLEIYGVYMENPPVSEVKFVRPPFAHIQTLLEPCDAG